MSSDVKNDIFIGLPKSCKNNKEESNKGVPYLVQGTNEEVDFYFEIKNNELNNKVKSIIENIVIKSAITTIDEKELQKSSCNALKEIYLENKNFRHDYFSIFQCISKVEGNGELFDAINTNIEGMKKIVIDGNQKGVYGEDEVKKFMKFFQYTQMELLRTKKGNDDMNKINEISKRYEEATEKLDNANCTINELEIKIGDFEKRVKDAENGYLSNLLSTLGLFAGVIIAFFGGLELLISVFNNINAISKYRLVFVGLMVGFLMFNTIAAMMVLLGRMIGKEIYKECDCDICSQNERYIFLFVKKIKNRLPYIYYIDTLLLTLMGIDFTLWLLSKVTNLPL